MRNHVTLDSARHIKEKFLNKKQGIFLSICLALIIITSVCFFLCIKNESFANFFIKNISAPLRVILAKITDLIPISAGEILVVSLSFLQIFYFLYYSVAIIFSRKRALGKYLKFLFFSLLFVIIMLCISFSGFFVLYKQKPIIEKMQVEKIKVTDNLLYDASYFCIKQANYFAEYVDFLPSGASLMPYSHKELSNILNQSYMELSEKYDFITPMQSRVKDLALSYPMTYTHISGMYLPFSGEANVNINYPDYVIAFTYAHEMAHQRGIASEDEANFMAYLAMTNSKDLYLSYSANITMLDYLIPEVYELNSEKAEKLMLQFGVKIIMENNAYRKFFDKYSQSKASELADKVNDTYLKSQGQESGVKSYSQCINLLISYLKSKDQIQ